MMKNYEKVSKIYDISKEYDLVLFDIWGVIIKDANFGINEKNIEVLNKIILEREVLLVTNAPRPNSFIKTLLSGINIEQNKIVTSGDMTIDMLKDSASFFNIKNPKIYLLGFDDHRSLITESKVDEVHDIEHADILLLAIRTSGKVVDDYNEVLLSAVERNIPVIVANPDKILSVDGNVTYLPGTYADIYSKMGGKKLIYAGKPYKDIFEYAIKKAQMSVGKDKILMIGDTIDTDIIGAKNTGIDSALTVYTGNINYAAVKKEADSYLNQCKAVCDEYGVFPDHFVEF